MNYHEERVRKVFEKLKVLHFVVWFGLVHSALSQFVPGSDIWGTDLWEQLNFEDLIFYLSFFKVRFFCVYVCIFIDRHILSPSSLFLPLLSSFSICHLFTNTWHLVWSTQRGPWLCGLHMYSSYKDPRLHTHALLCLREKEGINEQYSYKMRPKQESWCI